MKPYFNVSFILVKSEKTSPSIYTEATEEEILLSKERCTIEHFGGERFKTEFTNLELQDFICPNLEQFRNLEIKGKSDD